MKPAASGGLFVFLLVFTIWASQPAATGKPMLNGFDLADALVPADEIHAGGPPRDGIPSIDRPVFVEPSGADFLRPDDQLVSVSTGGETRGYPLRILVWHEIVNDVIGDAAIAITYCPLCGTAMVFDRVQQGRVLSFGVSGLLYQSDVLMYDRQTESLWSQLGMEAVSGRYAGTPLRWLPSEQMTWKAWRERFPRGRVLSTETGFRRDYSAPAYAGYEESPRLMFSVPAHRTELGHKEWIAGIIVGGQAKAYRLEALTDGEEIDDEIAGVPVRVRYVRGERRFVAERRDTGERIPAVMAYWFAWQAFYPDTELK